MARTDRITVKAGDTEPLVVAVDAEGLDDLTGVTTVEWFFRVHGETALHVDGAAGSVEDATEKLIALDPVNNGPGGSRDAFDVPGLYQGHAKLTMTDGDESRYPGKGYLWIQAEEALG